MVQIINKKISQDGSAKYLMMGKMNSYYEAIIFPDTLYNKKSICISTQYGCKMKCLFCATGYTKFDGNLGYEEMKDTVLLILDDYKISHNEVELVALMGMGEPLDNFYNIKEFLLNSTVQLGIKRYALSTIGIPEKICSLADLDIGLDLSISLHFTNDEARHRYMPGTSRYKIDDIRNACIYFYNQSQKGTDNKVRISYMLMKDLNDDIKFASILMDKFSEKYFKIVILSYNEIEEYDFEGKVDDNTRQRWYDFFIANGYEVIVRNSLGQDIHGGCGQLKGKFIQ